MKRFTLILAALLLPLTAHAQLSGKLATTHNEPIPFANVLLLNPADSTLIKGTLTTEAGAYSLTNIPTGQYLLRFSAVGFKTYNTAPFTITNTQPPQDFGTQALEEISLQLQEIVVQADKPLYQQEVDRTVINVESSVLTQGSSALQVLERSPGITLDPRNNSLVLNGKSSVMVMLNGKLMRLPTAQVVAMLSGMSANDIEKIEILTTPPARYDAEGNAGMINIITRKNQAQGTNGAVSATAGYGWKEKAAGSVNLTHNRGAISTHASYAFLHDHSKGGWHALSTQNMPAMGGLLDVDFQNMEKVIANSHNATLGIEAAIRKTTLGASLAYATSHANRNIVNAGRYIIIQADSTLPMIARIDGRRQWQNIIAGIYIEQQLRESEKINLDADYLRYTNENPTDINTTFFDPNGNEIAPAGSIFSNHQRSIAHAPIEVGVLKADYNRQLNPKLKIEAGLKGTLTHSNSQATIQTLVNNAWVSNTRTENNIDMKESIGAAYTEFQWQITPAANLRAGARYEYSHTQLNAAKPENNVNRKLSNIFPAIFFSKKLGEQSELQLSYTKRISRPSYNDLASYLIYNDPMSVETGNPTLLPTLTDNLKVGYVYSGYAFSILASRDNHPIVRYQLSDSPAHDLMYVAPQNMAWQNNLTLQATTPIKATPWWTMSYTAAGSLRQFKLEHTQEKLEKTYLTYTLNGSHTINLPAKLYLEISGWYNAFQFDGSKRLQAFGTLNAGLKKELKNNAGSFQLTVSDILKSIRYSNSYGYLTPEVFAIRSNVVYRPESANAQIIKLTYTRPFGKTGTKEQQPRANTSKDERDRIRKE